MESPGWTKLAVAEMRTLRWLSGVARLDKVGCGGNEDVKMAEWSHQAGQN